MTSSQHKQKLRISSAPLKTQTLGWKAEKTNQMRQSLRHPMSLKPDLQQTSTMCQAQPENGLSQAQNILSKT